MALPGYTGNTIKIRTAVIGGTGTRVGEGVVNLAGGLESCTLGLAGSKKVIF